MSLYFEVFNFLKERVKKDTSLLLAFSGGPDSTALLYLLLEVQKTIPFELELAHIDHKQREESSIEAEELKALAAKLGLVFHLKELSGEVEGNLEDFFRSKRHKFFSELYQRKGYQALILGHQRGDLEETVLKRFFEGAHLDKLSSIKPVTRLDQMTLWRPLLECSKEEVLSWLQNQEKTYIEDSTNLDESFLRARTRKTLLPLIEENFGKNIRSNLVRHSKSAALLEDYLELQTASRVVNYQNELGSYYDFSKNSFHPFEIQYLLRKFIAHRGESLSSDQLLFISGALQEGLANKRLKVRGLELYVDRRKFFIFSNLEQELPQNHLSLKPGTHTFGSWEVHVEEGSHLKASELGWKRFFKNNGTFFLQIPQGDYQLSASNLASDRFYFDKPLKSWLSHHKIPSFFSTLIPIIQLDKKVFAEILTGKTPFVLKESYLNVSLAYKKD